jgi:hypothetical protein
MFDVGCWLFEVRGSRLPIKWGAYQLSINTLWGGFEVALMSHWGGFCIQLSSFCLRPRVAFGGFAGREAEPNSWYRANLTQSLCRPGRVPPDTTTGTPDSSGSPSATRPPAG